MRRIESPTFMNPGFACFASRTNKGLVLFLLIELLVIGLAHADEYTGLAQDDPKEELPLVAPSGSNHGGFLPLPSWAHVSSLAGLPDVLTPNGHRKVVETTLPKAAPSLAPPSDSPASTVEAPVAKANPTLPVPPAPTPGDTTLMAVSPFLQWVKANPQAAAAEARQQAGTYAGPSASVPSGLAPTPAPAPYWLPPLLDTTPGETSGSSAAIYSTPQR